MTLLKLGEEVVATLVGVEAAILEAEVPARDPAEAGATVGTTTQVLSSLRRLVVDTTLATEINARMAAQSTMDVAPKSNALTAW